MEQQSRVGWFSVDFCRQSVITSCQNCTEAEADSLVCFSNTYPLDSVIHPLNSRGQSFKSTPDGLKQRLKAFERKRLLGAPESCFSDS